MKKKILAFGASSSKNSINKELARFTANQIKNGETEVLDLNDYELPIYSVDKEAENGIPKLAKEIKHKIQQADGIVVSFAEHNGTYSAAYKNVYDWVSRINMDVWEGTPMVVLSTSPGENGGKFVLESAFSVYSHFNPNVIGKFSLPSFYDNYNEGITDNNLKEQHNALVKQFESAL